MNSKNFKFIIVVIFCSAFIFGGENEQKFQTQFNIRFSKEIEKIPFSPDSLGNVLLKPHGLEVSSKAILAIEVSVDSLWIHEVSQMAKGLIRLELKGKLRLSQQKIILSEIDIIGKALDEKYENAFIAALYSLRWDKDEMRALIRQVKKNPGSEAL